MFGAGWLPVVGAVFVGSANNGVVTSQGVHEHRDSPITKFRLCCCYVLLQTLEPLFLGHPLIVAVPQFDLSVALTHRSRTEPIVLTFTFIGAIFWTAPVSLIEAIIYITKSDEDFHRIYVLERKAIF